MKKQIEQFLERLIFGSRWLLAPLYLGLILGMGIVVYVFAAELVILVSKINPAHPEEKIVVIGILKLLDMTLLGNLILIVIFSGYENFVSKITIANSSEDRPDWMGTVDFSSLKLKLIGSLVAISVIDLLIAFMDVVNFTNEQLSWKVGIHLTFVLSGVLFAVMDWLSAKTHQLNATHHQDHH